MITYDIIFWMNTNIIRYMNIYTEIKTSDIFLRQAILMVHNFKCFYSKEKILFNNFEIDHIIPRVLWWENCIANYLPTTKQINLKKGKNYKEEDFIELVAINKAIYAPMVLREYFKLRWQKNYKNLREDGFIFHDYPVNKNKQFSEDEIWCIFWWKDDIFNISDHVQYTKIITFPDWKQIEREFIKEEINQFLLEEKQIEYRDISIKKYNQMLKKLAKDNQKYFLNWKLRSEYINKEINY